MMKCSHCDYVNTNYSFCAGCGRELALKEKAPFVKLPDSSTKFLTEVIKTIEKIFSPDEMMNATLDMDTQMINMSDISKESGIFIIDDSQWKEVDAKVRLNSFFGETAVAYILSLILVLTGAILGPSGAEMTFKLFFTCYIFVSFLQWFIFPYLTGSTVTAFAGYRCSLFVDKKLSVRGKAGLLLILSIFMVLYSFVPFFLIEYVVASKIKCYVPVALKITGIDYLENIGGNH